MITIKEPSAAAMPDTTGLNFFEEDKNLHFVLERYLSKDDYQRAIPHLSNLGGVAGGRLDKLARMADKIVPELIHYNAKGERIDEIDYHPAYKEMEDIGYSEFGLVAMSHRPVLDFPTKVPHVLKYAFWYVFAQSEFGLTCPMNGTDSAARSLEKFASEDMKRTYLPRMTSTNPEDRWTVAQFMTEKQGGSDVGANTVSAKEMGNHWKIWGDKWFCSNVSADIILVLARPEGAPEGTKGLGLFLVPRKLPDGTLNHLKINRLKDKLGTRSMASGEVSFEGAVAYVVGDANKGFKQQITMVNASRLSNSVRSAAMIRRSFMESLVTSRGRAAFKKTISTFPLMKETLFELLLDNESSTAAIFYTADVYEKADQGDKEAEKLMRILTPVIKGYICKRARYTTAEAMEARGGNGYIEDWINPKLVRDAQLGSIWEGTTNIIALDILRALTKDKVGGIFYHHIYDRIDAIQTPLAGKVGDTLRQLSIRIEAQTNQIINMNGPERELMAKQLLSRMFHVLAASLLLEEADWQITKEGSYRKLYLTCQYIHRHMRSNGFDEISYPDASLLKWFDAIVDWGQVPAEAVKDLMEKN